MSLQLRGGFTDGLVDYKVGWPMLHELTGTFQLSRDIVNFTAEHSMVLDTEVNFLTASLPLNAQGGISVKFNTSADAQQLLEFVQKSDLRDWLTMVHPDWRGSGPVGLHAELLIPYRVEEEMDPGYNTIRFVLDGTDLSLTDIRMDLYGLNGLAEWQYPYTVEAELASGSLFDQPLKGGVSTQVGSTGDIVEFQFDSRLSVADAKKLVDVTEFEVGTGDTDFTGRLLIYPDSDRPTELFVTSELAGITIELPEPLGKAAEELSPSSMQMTFHDDTTQVFVQNNDLNGWLTFAGPDAELRQGSVAIGQGQTLPDVTEDRVVLSGLLDAWLFEFDQTELVQTHLRMDDLKIDTLTVSEVVLTQATLNGDYRQDEFAVNVESNEFSGVVSTSATDPYTYIDAEVFQWVMDESAEDVLAADLTEWLEPTRVQIGSLELRGVDDEVFQSWGRWEATIDPAPTGVVVSHLSASVEGIEIRSLSPLSWDVESNATTAHLSLEGSNIGETLVAFGEPAAVESEAFESEIKVTWSGSPLNVDFDSMKGELTARAESGRFVEIEQGAEVMRLFGLLNFSKVLNRLTLDFSDVFEPGLHFDDVNLDVTLEAGVVKFDDPIEVVGPGTRLLMSGTVDTNAETVDSELVVSFPLDKSLQAYAAYLASANPVAAIGLFIVTSALQNEVNALLSASYLISGSLDDPEVSFSSLFKTTPTTSAGVQN